MHAYSIGGGGNVEVAAIAHFTTHEVISTLLCDTHVKRALAQFGKRYLKSGCSRCFPRVGAIPRHLAFCQQSVLMVDVVFLLFQSVTDLTTLLFPAVLVSFRTSGAGGRHPEPAANPLDNNTTYPSLIIVESRGNNYSMQLDRTAMAIGPL